MNDDFSTFPLEQFRDELIASKSNFQIGTTIWYENNWIRLWDISVEAGERVPFHCHINTYVWVCEEPGIARVRVPDGRMAVFEYEQGDVRWATVEPGTFLIHDLENAGETRLRFTTIEFLAAPDNVPPGDAKVHLLNPQSFEDTGANRWTLDDAVLRGED